MYWLWCQSPAACHWRNQCSDGQPSVKEWIDTPREPLPEILLQSQISKGHDGQYKDTSPRLFQSNQAIRRCGRMLIFIVIIYSFPKVLPLVGHLPLLPSLALLTHHIIASSLSAHNMPVFSAVIKPRGPRLRSLVCDQFHQGSGVLILWSLCHLHSKRRKGVKMMP